MLEWDRSHDWVLERFWHDRTHVVIQLRQAPPSVAELVAVRRCLPQFRDMPPADLRAMIGDAGMLSLGVLPTAQAQQLIQAIEAQGLQVVTEDASRASYLPHNRTTQSARRIDDEAAAAALVREMLAAGVPVNNREE